MPHGAVKTEGSRGIANLHKQKVRGLFGLLLFNLRVKSKFRHKASIFRVNRFLMKTVLVHTDMQGKHLHQDFCFPLEHDPPLSALTFLGRRKKIKQSEIQEIDK